MGDKRWPSSPAALTQAHPNLRVGDRVCGWATTMRAPKCQTCLILLRDTPHHVCSSSTAGTSGTLIFWRLGGSIWPVVYSGSHCHSTAEPHILPAAAISR